MANKAVKKSRGAGLERSSKFLDPSAGSPALKMGLGAIAEVLKATKAKGQIKLKHFDRRLLYLIRECTLCPLVANLVAHDDRDVSGLAMALLPMMPGGFEYAVATLSAQPDGDGLDLKGTWRAAILDFLEGKRKLPPITNLVVAMKDSLMDDVMLRLRVKLRRAKR